MNLPLLVWGASGHARVVADAARLEGAAVIVGFIDDDRARTGESFEGSQIVGGRDALAEFWREGVRAIHIAVGHCAARLQLSAFATAHGYTLKSVIHPRATVADSASIGVGSFVAAGVVVNARAQIGASVILNTSCGVDHECVVEDGAHVGPGARLGGCAHVGRAAWLGIGATVLDRVKIGEGAILGGGAVAVGDVPPGMVAFGVPARVIRAKRAHE